MILPTSDHTCTCWYEPGAGTPFRGFCDLLQGSSHARLLARREALRVGDFGVGSPGRESSLGGATTLEFATTSFEIRSRAPWAPRIVSLWNVVPIGARREPMGPDVTRALPPRRGDRGTP